MPTIKYHQALASKAITQEFDADSFRLHTMAADEMTYVDKNGATVTLHGTGFKYTARGEVADGGTVSSISMRDADGHVLQTIKHIDPGHPATDDDPADPADFASDPLSIYSDFKISGSFALSSVFNGDQDKVIGSKAADILNGGAGKDFLSGGAGNDILSGDSGPDRLTGGGGRDFFFFQRGSGHDVVTDFHNGQDRIEVAHGMHDRLEMHQSGDNLILDFAWGDQVVLENVHKSEIGDNDFLLI